jgi:hypothetical protein
MYRVVCLVATVSDSSNDIFSSSTPLWDTGADVFEFPKLGYWLKSMTQEGVRPGLGTSYHRESRSSYQQYSHYLNADI